MLKRRQPYDLVRGMRNRGKAAGVVSVCLLVIGAVLLLYAERGCGGIDGPAYCYTTIHYDLSETGLIALYVGIFPGIYCLVELLNHH